MSCVNKQFLPKDERIRQITFFLYPESAPEDWQERLINLHTPYMYIYHDRDINPGGEQKKPHYHVVITYEGKKSLEQMDTIASYVGAANGAWEYVGNLRTMARYLCHMDNPEKAPYESSEVVSCSIDYNHLVGMPQDKYIAVGEMIDFCEGNNIVSFYELLLYARNNRYDWFKALCDNCSIVIKEYLKSKQWTQSKKRAASERVVVDPTTGEIIT